MPKLKIILSFLFFCAQQLAAQSDSGDDGYEIVRQDEKITLYERWTPYPGTATNARQIKSVFHVLTTLDRMVLTIKAEANVKAWQRNIIEYKVFPKTDSSWFAYSVYEIPWPLTNQDYLLNYSLAKANENQIVISFDHSHDDTLAPVQEGIDRMPTTGMWVLEKISKEKIKVTYTATSLPVSYPRFVTDRIVRNNFMTTINTLITVAEN